VLGVIDCCEGGEPGLPWKQFKRRCTRCHVI
jgi:hypothetical protein